MIKKEVLEKLREAGITKINRDLKNELNEAADDLSIDLAIFRHQRDIERLENVISLLEDCRTFSELKNVLLTYDYTIIEGLDIIF